MNKLIIFHLLCFIIFLQACHSKKEDFDASGSFEADEVVVSAQLSGQLNTFNVSEGDTLKKGETVGTIDSVNMVLQKQQVQASIKALGEKTQNIKPQISLLQDQLSVQQSQLTNLQHEKERTERLVKADAATGKQLDDIIAQIDILQKQMNVTKQQVAVQKNTISTQNRGVLSEREPLQTRVAQLDDQISRATIVNPINGTVLTKYAEAGEMMTAGKALYKIADLSTITLRAYITGSQLAAIKLNQPATVLVDNGADDYKTYQGIITWISGKAEFTPKTIQTKRGKGQPGVCNQNKSRQ
jgi:HlyD family secretion protein